MKLKRFIRRLAFHLFRALAVWLARGGMERLRKQGERLGHWHYRLSFRQRRKLQRQVQQALPGQLDDNTASQVIREAYRVNDRAILEILAMYSGALSIDEVSRACDLLNITPIDQAQQRGQGTILLGLHMGNGVAMATALARRGYPVHVVFRESGKITPAFFANGLPRMGLIGVDAQPASSAIRRMLGVLKKNGILFILMDQGMKNGGVPARLLGKQQQMPPGPAELARRSGAGVVIAALEGVSPRWQFRFETPQFFQRDHSREEIVSTLTQIMQNQIEKHPQWWTWHQRRWSRYPFIEDVD